MIMKSLVLAASFAALSAAQSTLGINRRGSSTCSMNDWGQGGLLGRLRGRINSIDSGHWYNNGNYIVCERDNGGGGICAFLQGTGGMPGSSIGGLLDALIQHGCEKCGSVPLWLPANGDNNPNDHGILTVNYVNDARGCSDLCSQGNSKVKTTLNNASAQQAQLGEVQFICTQETL